MFLGYLFFASTSYERYLYSHLSASIVASLWKGVYISQMCGYYEVNSLFQNEINKTVVLMVEYDIINKTQQ